MLCTLLNAREIKHASCTEEAHSLEGREMSKQLPHHTTPTPLFTLLDLLFPMICSSPLDPQQWCHLCCSLKPRTFTLTNSLWQNLIENCDL